MKPTRVFLHCAATQDYPRDNPAFDLLGAADIRVWHVKERGWNDIGYHWVIRRTGALEKGRPENIQGAGVSGYNRESIHVCYIGTRLPTSDQVSTLLNLYSDIKERHGIAWSEWFGHYEVDRRKTCPGIGMEVVRKMFAVYKTDIAVG